MNLLREAFLLMRLQSPIGALLLLWPTLWALWLAGDATPALKLIFIFGLGVWVMRAAGCVINDIADRRIDPLVKRTKKRPLARGALSIKFALILFFMLLSLALILVLQLNLATQLLSVVALVVAIIYPFSKRFIAAPQLVLGVAFSAGIPMAYASQNIFFSIEMLILFVANFLWVVAYDTQYAMVDRADDSRIGINSSARLFAEYDNLIIAILQIVCLLLILLIGWLRELNFVFYLTLAMAAGLIIYQQHLCWDREPQNCFRAFLNNNYFGALIFIGIVFGL